MDHRAIYALFDQLVTEGVISYHPHVNTTVVDAGFTFNFMISGSLTRKPQAGEDPRLHDKPNAIKTTPKNFGPGSDITFDDDRLLISTIKNTHYLTFNRFPVLRMQFLLLTTDSYRRQHEPLDEGDLTAAYETMWELSSGVATYYVFYNCGRESGASREHKHLQIIPQRGLFFIDTGYYRARIPFQFFICFLRTGGDEDVDEDEDEFSDESIREPVPLTGAQLGSMYASLLSQAKAALSLPADAPVCPHNFILTSRWMMVIPRRDAPHPVRPNSDGMMGYVWLQREEQVEIWKRIGPVKILSDYGVPNEMYTGSDVV